MRVRSKFLLPVQLALKNMGGESAEAWSLRSRRSDRALPAAADFSRRQWRAGLGESDRRPLGWCASAAKGCWPSGAGSGCRTPVAPTRRTVWVIIRDPCSRSAFGALGIFGTPAHLADEMFAATRRARVSRLDLRARTHTRAQSHDVDAAMLLRRVLRFRMLLCCRRCCWRIGGHDLGRCTLMLA